LAQTSKQQQHGEEEAATKMDEFASAASGFTLLNWDQKTADPKCLS